MIITTTDDDGELICVARLALDARKVVTLRLDDARGDRAFVGLNVLTGCIAAVLEDAARGNDGKNANEGRADS